MTALQADVAAVRELVELAVELADANKFNRPADLEQHEFYVAAQASIPAIERLLEAVTNLEKLEADLRTKMGDYQWSAYLHCANKIKRLLHPEDK